MGDATSYRTTTYKPKEDDHGALGLPTYRWHEGHFINLYGSLIGGVVYPDARAVDGVADEVQINAAIDSITSGIVMLTGTYVISLDASIICKSGVWLVGLGYGTLVHSTGNRTVPIVDIDGVTDVMIQAIRFSSNDDTQQAGQIEISGKHFPKHSQYVSQIISKTFLNLYQSLVPKPI